MFNSTVAVLTIVLISAVIVFALDFVFESINKYGLDKIKEAVSNSATEELSNEVVENETTETEVNTVVENTVVENTVVE